MRRYQPGGLSGSEIRPELQSIGVGDRIVLHGRSGFGPNVVRLEPERPRPGRAAEREGRGIWGFHLLDGPNGTTRLLERGRKVVGKGLPEKLGWDPYLMDPIRFVMSKKMLQNIKKLAEDSRS